MLVRELAGVRVLAVASGSAHHVLLRGLTSLCMPPVFVTDAAELANHLRGGQAYDVVMLPATLSDTDWWGVWAELALLDRKPEILVYAREASFQLWSSVLEAGGFDVIVAPFTSGKLEAALVRAAKSSRVRLRNRSAHD